MLLTAMQQQTHVYIVRLQKESALLQAHDDTRHRDEKTLVTRGAEAVKSFYSDLV